jgi:hypothetical protein
MHKIDTDGHVGNLFTDGNPSLGQAATIVDDDWLNAVQTEVVNVIEDAGITLVKGTNTQLLSAIDSKIIDGDLVTPNPAVNNLGFDLTTGTFKLVGRNGSVLSSTNKAKISIADALNPGLEIDLILDSDDYFFDDANGTSDIIGMEFGRATGVVNTALPVYQYITYDSSLNKYLVMTHDWNMSVMPATVAEIGYKLNPSTNNEDTDCFVAASTDVRAALVGRPVTMLGSARWTMDVNDDWQINTLDEFDGVGKYHWGKSFGKSISQPSGAAVGKHFFDNGGTAPAISANNIIWQPFPGGLCKYIFDLNVTGGANGSGGVSLALALPFKDRTTAGFALNGTSRVRIDTTEIYLTSNIIGTGLSFIKFMRQTNTTTTLNNSTDSVTNDEIINSDRSVIGSISFSAFGKD